MNKLLSLIFLIFLSYFSYSQCDINVNFNDWQLQGNPSNATWVISANGDTIEQTKAYSYTSFYVSQEDLINVSLSGKFYVNDPSDDDFIGLVCKFVSPNSSTAYSEFNTYVIDWKKAYQAFNGYVAHEGYTLFDVHGNSTNLTKYFFGHYRDAMETVMDSVYAGGLGWRDDSTYNFNLTYTTSKIIFSIDGDTIFNYEGCFDAGKLGIYNFSQMNAKYFGLSYKHLVDFDYPLSVCQHDTTDFVFINLSCAPNFDDSYIDNMYWDFGDGTTIANNTVNLSNINPQHAYSNPGIYNVKLIVTDTSGCVDSLIKQIYVKPIPYLTATSNSPVCQGDTIHLNTTNYPLTNYFWSGPNSFTGNTQNPFIANSALSDSGYYSVYAILDGCISPKDSVFVTIKPLPFTNPVANSPICESDTITITADYYQGANYYWTGPNGISSTDSILSVPNSTLNDSGYYYVYAILNGCLAPQDSVYLQIKPMPYMDIISNSPICEGDSLILNTDYYSGANYYWSGPNSFSSTDSIVNIINSSLSDSGYYYVYAELNGCTSPVDSELVKVNIIPVLNPTVNSPVCQGDTVVFNSTAYAGANYYWSGVNSFSSNIYNPTIYNVQMNNSGDYVVYAELNGCYSSTDTLNLIVKKTPTASFISTFINCYGDSTKLTYIGNADASANFTWELDSGISSGNYVYWNTSGYHTVTLTVEQAGCSSIDSLQILTPDSLTVNYTKSDNLCYGDSSAFVSLLVSGGTPAYSYQWNNGKTDSVINNLTPDNYNVTVKDSNNCVKNLSFVITQPTELVVNGNVDNINAKINTTVTGGTPGYTYLWSNQDTSKDLSNLVNGNYILTVTDKNGCQKSKEFTVLADLKIPLAITPNSDGYNDTWKIRGIEAYPKVSIEIYNRWGSKVYEFTGTGQQYNSNPWNGDFKNRQLPTASYVYILNLYNNQDPLSGTLLIKR